MAVKVVDASALAALLFGEPEADRIARQLEGARLIAPSLLGFGLANLCASKCRRDPEQQMALKTAFRLRGRLHVEEAVVDLDAVAEPAIATRLTAYDAGYLWLARQAEAESVTLDRPLAAAFAAS